MAILADLYALRQVHLFLDLGEQVRSLQDAAVGEKGKLSGSRCVHHPTTGRFLILHFRRDDAVLLEFLPNDNVIARVSFEIAILFGLGEPRAFDKQLAVEYPEDADAGFFLCSLMSFGSYLGSF